MDVAGITNSAFAHLADRRKIKFNADILRHKERQYGRPGFIYIMEGVEGISKIGRTQNDPADRLKEINGSVWIEVKLIYVAVIHFNHVEVEGLLHKLFSCHRLKGEWFSLTPQQIYDITYCKKEGVSWELWDEFRDYKTLEMQWRSDRREAEREFREKYPRIEASA
jgi:hypothetical protein